MRPSDHRAAPPPRRRRRSDPLHRQGVEPDRRGRRRISSTTNPRYRPSIVDPGRTYWERDLLPRLRTTPTVALARELGVNVSTVKRWKSGVMVPHRRQRDELRRVLGAKPQEAGQPASESRVARTKWDSSAASASGPLDETRRIVSRRPPRRPRGRLERSAVGGGERPVDTNS